MRLRREQDALTPTEWASYEEKRDDLLEENLDDMLEELEGPEEPPETERPGAQSDSQPAGSDPARTEVTDSEIVEEGIVAESTSTSDEKAVNPKYLAANILMQQKITEMQLAEEAAKLEGLRDIRAARHLEKAKHY